jgi:hypothetical protein
MALIHGVTSSTANRSWHLASKADVIRDECGCNERLARAVAPLGRFAAGDNANQLS